MVLFGLLYSVAYMTKDTAVDRNGYMTLRQYGYGWGRDGAAAEGGGGGRAWDSFLPVVREDRTLVTVEGRVDVEGGTLSSVIPLARLLELTHVTLASAYSGEARSLTVGVLSVTRVPAGPGEVWPTAVFTTPLGTVRLYGPEIRTDSDRVLALLGMPPLGSGGSNATAVSASAAMAGGSGSGARRLTGSGGGSAPAEWASLGSGGASGFFQVDVSPGGAQSRAWLATSTPVGTPSGTASPSASGSGSASPLVSPSGSVTGSPTRSGSKTQTGSGSETPTTSPTRSTSRSGTGSLTASGSPSQTASTTGTSSGTATGSMTRSSSATGSVSTSESNTRTSSPTGTMTAPSSGTGSPTATVSASGSQTRTGTPSPTSTLTGTPSPTSTLTSSGSTSLTSSATPSLTGSGTPTSTASGTGTVSTTISSTATASLSGSATGTASTTGSVSGTPPPTPSPTGSAVPTCANVAYRRYLDPATQSAVSASGSSGTLTLGSSNAGTTSMYLCGGPAGDGTGGQGYPTDYFVVNIGAQARRGGDLTLSTCGSELDTLLFYGVCAASSVGAVSAGDFTCSAGSDDACGSGSLLVIPGVTGQFHQVGVAGFGNASGTFRLDWQYNEPATPTPTPPGTPSNSGTGTNTPAPSSSTSATRSSSASSTGTPSPSATATGTPPSSVTATSTPSPTVSAVNSCGGYPFRATLTGTSGVAPVAHNNFTNFTRLFGCPGTLDPYVPYWYNASGAPTPVDFYMLDLGPDT